MRKNSYCFGTGREQFAKTVVNRDRPEPDRNLVPPNLYDPYLPLGEEAVGFKLKYKIDFYDDERLARKNNYPGAGTYED